jgi:O-antigen ligase
VSTPASPRESELGIGQARPRVRVSQNRDIGSWAPPFRERLALAACLIVLFGFHALYGALTSTASLLMSLAWATLLLIGLATSAFRARLATGPSLLWPALGIVLVLAAACWSMSPASGAASLPIGPPGGRSPISLDPSATAIEAVKLIGLCCAFLVGAETGGSDTKARKFLTWLVYAGAAFALAGIAIFAFGLAPQTQHDRLEILFMDPDTAGTVLGVLLVIAAALLVRNLRGDRVWRNSVLDVGCAIVLTIALVLTASRGALVATLLALLVVPFAERRRLTLSLRVVCIVAAGIAATALLALVVTPHLWTRISNVSSDAAVRYEIFQVHWYAFLRSPFFGYGLGCFDTLNQSLLTPATLATLWNIRSAENVYLQWLVEAGLAGALPMFACVGYITVDSARRALNRTHMQHEFLALIGCDVVFLVHGYTDFALQTPSVAAFWSFLLGLQFTLAERRR